MLTAVPAVCGVSVAVLAALLRCNTTHRSDSEIHSVFVEAVGTSLGMCQCCRFGDSPYVPQGRRLWPR